jgi:hypothetical protein
MSTNDQTGSHSAPPLGEREKTSASAASAEFFAGRENMRYAPPVELCNRLLALVGNAAADSATSMDALRAVVEEFTVNLQAQGAAPEAVLIVLKALIRNQAFGDNSPSSPYVYRDPVRESITSWSIKEFFREKPI